MNAADNDADMQNLSNSPFAAGPLFGDIPKMPPVMNNPFQDIKNTPKTASESSDFNVDELVKKIDAKIAELEEEERRNKKEQEEKKKSDNLEVIGDKESETLHSNIEVDKNKSTSSLNLDDDDDDSDEFFDDFFDN